MIDRLGFGLLFHGRRWFREGGFCFLVAYTELAWAAFSWVIFPGLASPPGSKTAGWHGRGQISGLELCGFFDAHWHHGTGVKRATSGWEVDYHNNEW